MTLDTQRMVAEMKAEGVFKPLRGGVKENPRDVLSGFDRDIVGGPVRFTIQLNDPVELRSHLVLLRAVAERLIIEIDRSGKKDRTVLLTAKASLRMLNQKLNAFKAPRRL